MAIKVFCCYAHKDEALLNRLREQLNPLERNGLLEVWYDGEISAGTRWEAELYKRLHTAQIILFLVSPHFISSHYCYNVEVSEAVKRYETGEARVIPIILRPVHWQETPFGQLQALPKDGKPITRWRDREEAIFNVVAGITKVVNELSTNEAITETPGKPTISPVDDDPEPPLTGSRDSSERDHEEERAASDTHTNKSFEEQRLLATQFLEKKQPQKAVEIVSSIRIGRLPMSLRWRLAALRGECHFNMRDFAAAQLEFRLACAILPEDVPADQRMEALLLRLHMAAASRELGQYELAYEQFLDARAQMDDGTPLRLVAEAQWGMSLVLYERAYKYWNEAENDSQQDHQEEKKAFLELMQQSLDYAENACALYDTINELSRSALMNCQVALIEQSMKNLDAARLRLRKVLEEWLPAWKGETLDQSRDIAEKVKRYSVKERSNILSAAACYLASIELDAKQWGAALEYVDLAVKASQDSYLVRRADAYMTKGQILAAMDDPEAIVAFRQALAELEQTHREGAKIRVHLMLGAYLIKHGAYQAGKAELDKALHLANIPATHKFASGDGSS